MQKEVVSTKLQITQMISKGIWHALRASLETNSYLCILKIIVHREY